MKNQRGLAVLESILITASVLTVIFAGWYIFIRPSMESRHQLSEIFSRLQLPSSYTLTKTRFWEESHELSTVYSMSKTYTLTSPTTRAEALQQIVKSLGLNPEDHKAVNIHDEQLNGVASPLFPPLKNGSTFEFSASLQPSYTRGLVKGCEGLGSQELYRDCVNKDPVWGKDALVKSITVTVDK